MKRDEPHRYWVEEHEFETPEPQRTPDPWGETRVVGTRRPRVDAYERVSGSARYPSDVILPGMIFGAILRCPHPHARVRGVDVRAAQAIPGVRAVISAFTPLSGALGAHEKLMRETLFPSECRYEGEDVAAVAADTPYIARDALRAIVVDYEPLPFVSDERDALVAGAPLVRPEGNRVAAPAVYERGSVQAGFAAADVVVEQELRTECEFHAPLEPHGCVATWDGDSLTVHESTQGVFPVQNGLAAALGIPLSKVRVIGSYMGGGFGSKLSLGKYTTQAALLAKVAARPVKLFITREETFLAAGNRPPANMRVKIGAKRDGTLTAIEYAATGTGGAFQAGGTSGLDFIVRDLYACPNVHSELQDIFINAGPARAMRAPGHPQCAWAVEQTMDLLAEKLGMDPIELRLKNIPTVSQSRGDIPYTTTGLAECLRRGAEAFGWSAARSRAQESTGPVRRGVGVAAGMWSSGGGGPPSTAIVKVFADGSVNLNLGASDLGTGTKTVMAMIVAEELWVDPDSIQIEHADTGTTQYASASGGSKTIPTESPAVRAAALEVKGQILALAAAQLGVEAATLELREGKVVTVSGAPQEVRLGELRELRRAGVVVGVGYRGPNPQGKAVNPFAAHFCEVQVDTRSGEVEILRFLAVQDSGRVMNRTTYENQVRGGVVMGIGLGTTERRVLDRGRTGLLVNRGWVDYRIPTALDVPPVLDILPVDLHDKECNHTGAKGIGEPATIPTAPAIANAVFHATGVRITGSPITPAKVVDALAAQRRED
ncbi:MAG TPA: xanthine dehydrogenase family protein molybdopterin-binding subunit [Longimicrobiales bacterium]|nr:xanthine dehydrogenase family protein molybdopterin-binding subunit [Longimicrobiales bacterium]